MASLFHTAIDQAANYSLDLLFELELGRGYILRHIYSGPTQRADDHAMEIAVGKARRIAVSRALLRRLTHSKNKTCHYLTEAASVLEEGDVKLAILSRSGMPGLTCDDYDWAMGEYLRKHGNPVEALRTILDPLLPQVFARVDAATNSTPIGPLPSPTPSINYATLMNFNPLAHPNIRTTTLRLAGSINLNQTNTLHPGNLIPRRLRRRTDAQDNMDKMQLELLAELCKGLYEPLPPIGVQNLCMEYSEFRLSAFEGDADIKLATAVLLAARCKGNTSLQSFNCILLSLNTNLAFATGLDGKEFFGEGTEEHYGGRVFEAIYKQALETEGAQGFARWREAYFLGQISFLLARDKHYFPITRSVIASSTSHTTQAAATAITTNAQQNGTTPLPSSTRRRKRKAKNESPNSKRAKLSHGHHETPERKRFQSCVIC